MKLALSSGFAAGFIVAAQVFTVVDGAPSVPSIGIDPNSLHVSIHPAFPRYTLPQRRRLTQFIERLAP